MMTPHVKRILLLKAEGLTNAEVAEKLHITPTSVDLQLHRVCKRHNCTNLIQFFYKQGWLKVFFPTDNSHITNGL